MRKDVTPGKTPPKISVMQIDQDLKDGISKSEMAIKYGIKPWEVDEMFKHPFLKGRRPSRKKALSFTFVDDTDTPEITGIPNGDTDEEYVDPNQTSIDDVNEITSDTPEWKAEDSKTGEKIELDQGAQEVLNECLDTMVNEDGETLRETFDKEIEAGNIPEEKEEELEMEDDTFEL